MKREFITEYLKDNLHADVLNAEFHDLWHDRFGGARVFKFYGASPCKNAMYHLKQMYDEGILSRHKVPISEMPSGFPNWVYTYELPRKQSGI